MRHILLLVASSLCAALPAGAAEPSEAEAEGLAAVRSFTLEHNAALVAEAEKLQAATSAYAALITGQGGDYEAAWSAKGPELAAAVTAIRKQWLATSNEYETIEGIVAGLPAMVKYDLILDAGNPGGQPEDVAEYDLALPDGTVLERPGNLFHGITEPLMWGTDDTHVKLKADLDGDGKTGAGEVLFDANLAVGATEALVFWAKALETDMKAWEPGRNDAFTAVVTMTPTVGDYFAEWKDSHLAGGLGAAFVARSRLADVTGIMGGCQRMYVDAVSPVLAEGGDTALDASIRGGFDELLALVAETRAREEAGETFGAEEADALAAESQDIAERIVAQVLQAAAKYDVQIEG